MYWCFFHLLSSVSEATSRTRVIFFFRFFCFGAEKLLSLHGGLAVVGVDHVIL